MTCVMFCSGSVISLLDFMHRTADADFFGIVQGFEIFLVVLDMLDRNIFVLADLQHVTGRQRDSRLAMIEDVNSTHVLAL